MIMQIMRIMRIMASQPSATLSLALWAILVTSVPGCREPAGEPRWRAAGATAPQRGGTLRFSTSDSIRTLDPAIAYDEVSSYPAQHLFDTLIGFSPVTPGSASRPGAGLALVPQLAESWQISPDGLHLRFTLRAGLRYHDGAPIVAGDFKYALERVLRTADSPFAGFLSNVVGAVELRDGKASGCSGLIAATARDFEVVLKTRDAAFPYLLTMKFAAPLRRDYVERHGAELGRQPLASGPYQLASWRPGQRLVLTRNPYHWDRSRGWIDEISMLENVPREVEFLMFERGDLDVCFQPSAPDYLWLLEQPTWQPFLRRVQLMNVFGERMNVTRPPLSDVRVRRALNYAFNKAHIVRLLQGTATIAHGILPPGMVGRDDQLAPYPYDPERAKQLLAEAGYPDGFELDYVTLAGDEPRKLASSLQADLAKVGVRLNITAMSFSTWQAAVGTRTGPALSFTSWTQDYPDPASFVDVRFHSRMISERGSLNDSFYANAQVDALIDLARAELDPARRATQYQQLERLLYDDAPWIWGYHRVAIEVVQPYVAGYSPHPVWLRDYSSSWLDLGRDGRRLPRQDAQVRSAGGSR
jgi:ABC-type transport system substrate-binding protein